MKPVRIENVKWQEYSKNPIISPPFGSPLIADSSVLTPEEGPDGKWHMFAHSIFGIHHYISVDGLGWKRIPGVASFLGIRPFVFYENGKYYLFYERLGNLLHFPNYSSHMEVKVSNDLASWSKAVTVFKPDVSWPTKYGPVRNVGNPYVIKIEGEYRLYYSAGLIKVPDMFFNEPAATGVARAKKITGPFVADLKPETEFDGWKNEHPTDTRIYHLKGGDFVKLQLYYYLDGNGQSHSAIRLLTSKKAYGWKIAADPIVGSSGNGWKSTHVYLGDLKFFKGEFLLYFTGRDGRSRNSKERIGVILGK